MKIEKLVYGGEGLARDNGRVVLAPYVLPGETVRLEPQEEKPAMVRARLRLVLEPSEHRAVPPCKHFMRCGGCSYQHAGYAYQLDQKREILREVLSRVGKFQWNGEIHTIAGPEWGYRNRVQLHFAHGKMGFHGSGSHRIESIAECPVASPKLNEAIAALQGMLGDRRWPYFLKSLELFTNETDLQTNVLDSGDKHLARPFFDWLAERIPGAGATAVDYTEGPDTFRVSYKSFFQTNRFLSEALVAEALATAPESADSAWDLYAGVGLFSLPLARRFARVTGVESSASAASNLEFNAQRAGLNIAVEHMPVDAFLSTQTAAPAFVLADPPRAGLGKSAVDHLVRLAPKQLVIVSCDPSTFARDLATLLAGGYTLERLVLADLFPHTAHLETIAHLRRN